MKELFPTDFEAPCYESCAPLGAWKCNFVKKGIVINVLILNLQNSNVSTNLEEPLTDKEILIGKAAFLVRW